MNPDNREPTPAERIAEIEKFWYSKTVDGKPGMYFAIRDVRQLLTLSKSLLEQVEKLHEKQKILANTMLENSKELLTARLKLAAAKEYVKFLEEFWGIDSRFRKNPMTLSAHQKYIEAMK